VAVDRETGEVLGESAAKSPSLMVAAASSYGGQFTTYPRRRASASAKADTSTVRHERLLAAPPTD